jgi:hypothetical protein
VLLVIGAFLSTTGGPEGPPPVAMPIPPTPYSLPAGATVVSSSEGLTAALAAGMRTIVLADGTYGASHYFDDWNGSSVIAQNLGGAILTAGLAIGSNSGTGGGIMQGLAFDVLDPAATLQGGELTVWGPAGRNTQVLDSTFEGNWAIAVGLLDMNPDGLTAQRLHFAHFTDEGLRASDDAAVGYGSPTPIIATITDISVDGVSRSTPGSSNGTAEAGLLIGQPVANGVHRIEIRNCAWSGIETANNAWDTTYSDLDIDMSGSHAVAGTAIYLEHFSLDDVFTNFRLAGASIGFKAEWDDGTPRNEAARNDTIENGIIDASGWTQPGNTAGVFLDQGTNSTTIVNVTFEKQNWAGIGTYKNSGTNTFANNTYDLASGAAQVSSAHI